ncbi:MAG: carbamoyltransferase C-terminal domain-containing protein [Chthoniobacterales bacterium]
MIRQLSEGSGTSFNESEPVVCRREEALDCFLRIRVDVIVLENYFVERQTSQEALAALSCP